MKKNAIKTNFEVLQAYVDGKSIQFKAKEVFSAWKDFGKDDDFDDELYIYRVKDMPKREPFVLEDNIVGNTIKSRDFSSIHLIICQYIDGVRIYDRLIPYHILAKEYVFYPSGKPCSKEVE